MTLSYTHKIIIGFVVCVAVVLAVLFVNKKQTFAPVTNTNATTTSVLASTTGSGVLVNAQGTGQFTIKQVPVNEGRFPTPVPDLSRNVVFGGQFPPDENAQKIIVDKVVALQTQLKSNPAFLAGWIDLGLYQKMAGDYDGAIISWKYATKLAPDNFVSTGNLGNLYAYYVKDNAQAEMYYKEAIKKGPTQAYLYFELANVYKDVFGDMDKARAIVNEGLKKMPNSKELSALQDSLK